MIDEKFDVVFRGQIVKGRDLDEVKNNLVSLFKSSLNAVESLFSGADIKIKKSLDYVTAMKYQTALKQAGALAIISEVVIAKEKANFMSADDESEVPEKHNLSHSATENELSTTKKIINAQQSKVADSGMTMAEVGSQLMPDKVYEKRDIDTSDLSLAKVGERILPPKVAETHAQPSIDHLSLEEE